MQKYWQAFLNSWQYNLQFRANTLFRLLVSFFVMIAMYYLWSSLFDGHARIAGYTREKMLSYYLFMSIINGLWVGVPISEQIREGELSALLTKPMNVVMYHYFFALGKRIFRLSLVVIGLVFVLSIFRRDFFVPSHPLDYAFLGLAFFGSMNLFFLFDVITGMLEFWFKYIDMASVSLFMLIGFFSGIWLPLKLLPLGIQNILQWMPFTYSAGFVANGFLGQLSPRQMLIGLLSQTIWVAILVIVAAVIWRKGLKRYEAFGS